MLLALAPNLLHGVVRTGLVVAVEAGKVGDLYVWIAAGWRFLGWHFGKRLRWKNTEVGSVADEPSFAAKQTGRKK